MSARLTDTNTGVQDSSKSVQSGTTGQLEGALAALNIGKPPPNVTPGQFFAQICSVIEKINANDRRVKTDINNDLMFAKGGRRTVGTVPGPKQQTTYLNVKTV